MNFPKSPSLVHEISEKFAKNTCWATFNINASIFRNHHRFENYIDFTFFCRQTKTNKSRASNDSVVINVT